MYYDSAIKIYLEVRFVHFSQIQSWDLKSVVIVNM